MNRQWLATALFLFAVVAAPWLAGALWRRDVSKPVGYAAGFALIVVAVVVVRTVGGLPRALR